MTEIGTAYLSILPSLSGRFRSTLNSQVAPIGAAAGAQAGGTFGGAFSTAAGTGLGATGALAGVAKTGIVGLAALGAAGAVAGVKTAAGMENADIAFTTMLGSATKADGFLRDLSKFAAKTPFEFPELQTAAGSLISAGFQANKVIPIMTTLGNVTSGMGTGSEGVKRATVALQQMQAAGRITAEDLNQLRDAGVPVFDLLSAATGKTKEEIAAMAATGKLGKTEMQQLFTALETGKGLERFNGLMNKQSASLSGMFSTLKDTANMTLANLITPALPAIKSGLGLMIDLTGQVGPAIKSISAFVKPAIGTVRRFFTGLAGNAQARSAFAAIVPVVRTVGTAIRTTFRYVSAAFKADGIAGAFSALAGSVGMWAPVIKTRLMTLGASFLSWLGPIIPPLLAKVGGVLRSIGDAVITYYPRAYGALLRLGGAFLDWVGPLIPPLLTKLGQFGAALFGWVTGTALPRLGAQLVVLGNALVGWIGPRIPPLLAEAGRLGRSLFGYITGTALPRMGVVMGQLAEGLVGWVLPKIPGIVAELGTLMRSIASWIITTGIPKAAGAMADLGIGLVQGIGRGFATAFPSFVNNLLDVIPGWVKKALGINGAKIDIPKMPAQPMERPAIPAPRGPVARSMAAQPAGQGPRSSVAAQYSSCSSA